MRTRTIALLLAIALAGCGDDEGGSGRQTVRVGTVAGFSADAAMFIAVDKGYFKAEGLDIAFERFDSGARMIAPLGSGQLDVASGSISAGLYNAIDRGVKMKIVADKARVVAPGFQGLIVRKPLVESGKFKGVSDLRGLKIAIPATGTAPERPLYLWLKKGGVDPKDVRIEQVGFPDQIPALQNGSIDAAMSIEPSLHKAVESGAAERIAGTSDVFPDQQTSGILFGDRFAGDRETAEKFLVAYLKGVRFYNDALRSGKLAGAKGDEVARILQKHTGTDAQLFKTIVLHGVDPDGRSNVASLEADLQFWKDQGYVKSDVSVRDALDESLVTAAAKRLGSAQ